MEIKLLEDLQQIELTVELMGQKMFVSIYLIDGLLIDTGPYRKKNLLIPFFQEENFSQVVLTHHHEDHTGLANWISRNKNVDIYIHEKGIEKCLKKERLPFYRYMFWGKREPFTAKPLDQTFETDNHLWEIIHTPGHADDHVALYNRKRGWMFGGDLYVQPKPKSIFAFESIPTMIQSLKKLLAYDFDTYICSHAGIMLNGKKAIKNKFNYLVSVQQEVMFLHNKGMSPQEITEKMFPKRHMMNYISFFENSPKHIVQSILK